MQVSFIIPLFNCLALTRDCVATLQKSLPVKLVYEIILVDDGSTDGTREWLQTLAHPFHVIINETNHGYAKSNNIGSQAAQGKLLCLLNNDLIFAKGWWQPLLRLHQRFGSRAGAIGNVQRRVNNRRIDHSGIFINAKVKPEHDRNWYPWPRRQRNVAAVTGACLLINRETFLQNNGFDEVFVNGGEDVDLCFRLTQRGLINAVALRSTVLHHVSASPGRKQRDEVNSFRLAKKWRPQLTALALRPWGWQFLRDNWARSQSPIAWTDAANLLAYLLHLSSKVPRSALDGINLTMDAEFTRWRNLFPED